VGLRVQTAIKRRKIKNRPNGTECNAVNAEELNYELSYSTRQPAGLQQFLTF